MIPLSPEPVAGSRSLARPKSRIFTRPSSVMKMFSGFRSRCTIETGPSGPRKLCARSKARATGVSSRTMRFSGNGACPSCRRENAGAGRTRASDAPMRSGQRLSPEQQLGLGTKRVEEVLARVGQNAWRQPQALERHRRAKAAVVRAVHGAKAAFGHHGLDRDPDGLELDWMRFGYHFRPGKAPVSRAKRKGSATLPVPQWTK